MGWERKRGKLEELNRLLRGATDTSYDVQVGELGVLPSVRYCITLDSDTRLPRDGAKKLVGIIAHPLNRPRLDPRSGRVTEGYGILQPRVSVTIASAAGSRFARIFAGHTGVDPYTTAVSDTYQDLFGEGSFTGKGLYDVDAFTAALDGRVPDNTLLSHDLFEGLHARTGARDRRRGRRRLPLERARPRAAPAPLDPRRLADPRLAPARRPDARRPRAEPPPAHRALEDLRQPAARTGRAGDRPPAPPRLDRAAGRPRHLDRRRRRVGRVPALHRSRLAALTGPRPHQPIAGLPARARGGRRGHRGPHPAPAHLPREPGVRDGARDPRHARPRRDHAGGACSSGRPPRRAPTAAPGWRRRRAGARSSSRWWRAPRSRSAASSSRPPRARVRSSRRGPSSSCGSSRRSSRTGSPSRCASGTSPSVRRTASSCSGWPARPGSTSRRSWARTITSCPRTTSRRSRRRIAHRTSPTNIGMGLLSTLAAHDLGLIATGALVERVEATLTTIEGLERLEGHLFNWYDTQRSRRCSRATSRPSTAGTSPARSSRSPRGSAGSDASRPRPGKARAIRSTRLEALSRRAVAFADGMSFRFLYDRAAAASSRSGTAPPTPRGRGGSTPPTTTCSPPRRASRASSRSRRATCPRSTGSISAARSRASTGTPRSCPGARRSSST